MTKRQELIDFVLNLTDEQGAKIVKHLPLIKQIVNMTDNELIYTQSLTTKLFGNGCNE